MCDLHNPPVTVRLFKGLGSVVCFALSRIFDSWEGRGGGRSEERGADVEVREVLSYSLRYLLGYSLGYSFGHTFWLHI